MSKVNKYNLVSENPQSTVVAQYTPVYRTAQYAVFKAVNTELITLYWDIGRMIVEWQKKHSWGKAIVENLAEDLQLEFPGTLGLSKASLWRMKLFYEEYANNVKLAPLVREIGWSHNLCTMEKCKDDLEREFYIRFRTGRKMFDEI